MTHHTGQEENEGRAQHTAPDGNSEILPVLVISFENGCCVASVSIPSFPHVFSGNPGEFGLDPRLKHSG